MSYEGITNLNELSPATPLDGASQAEMALAIRQLKAVFKNVLLASLHPNGLLRELSSDVLSTEAVGTDQLKALSVTEAKLADGAVTATKLGLLAVITAALNDNAVTGDKIDDEALLLRHFSAECIPLTALAEAITSAYISSSAINNALRAISSDHIQDGAVTDRTITDVAVGKLSGGDIGQMLVKSSTGWIPLSLTGGLTFNTTTNQFEIASSVKQAYFADHKARGSHGGASAVAWTTRDLGEISDIDGLMTFSGNSFKLLPGTYAFFARCPVAGAIGVHQARLVQTNVDASISIPIWGTSESCTAAQSNASEIRGILVVTDADAVYHIEHWCQNVVTIFGLGAAAASNNSVVYANHVEVFTSGYLFKLS